MRRADPERIYIAWRAAFVARLTSADPSRRQRVAAVVDALEPECEALGLERGLRELWAEAERRVAAGSNAW